MGFPSGSDSKESAGNARYLGWKDPLEKGMLPTLVFLPGEFHGQRRLGGGYSPWGRKELDMIEQLTLLFFFTFSGNKIWCSHFDSLVLLFPLSLGMSQSDFPNSLLTRYISSI